MHLWTLKPPLLTSLLSLFTSQTFVRSQPNYVKRAGSLKAGSWIPGEFHNKLLCRVILDWPPWLVHLGFSPTYLAVWKLWYALISEFLEEMKFHLLSNQWKKNSQVIPDLGEREKKSPTLFLSEEMRDLKSIVVLWIVVCHSPTMECQEGMSHDSQGKRISALCSQCAWVLWALMQWMPITQWSSSEG